MEEEIKINVPIITNQELENLRCDIEREYDSYVDTILRTVSKEKDIIILREIIKYQDKTIDELKKLLKLKE